MDIVSLSDYQRISAFVCQIGSVRLDRVASIHSPVSPSNLMHVAFICWTSILTRLLMFGSGVPTAEKPMGKRYYMMSYGPDAREGQEMAWRNYKTYRNETSVLIPIPPALYRTLPGFLKRTILLDFPMYQFGEEDGKKAVEDAKRT